VSLAPEPVIVGAATLRTGVTGFEAAKRLAGDAVRAAIEGAGLAASFLKELDVLIVPRGFLPDETVAPGPDSGLSPSDLMEELKIAPRRLVWGPYGDDAVLNLLGEFATLLARGEFESMAIVTIDPALGEARSQSDNTAIDGVFLDDRGRGLVGSSSRYSRTHRLTDPAAVQLMANASTSAGSRACRDPGPGQSATALLLTNGTGPNLVAAPEGHRLFMRAHAAHDELPLVERPDLARSPAAEAAVHECLDQAGIAPGEVTHWALGQRPASFGSLVAPETAVGLPQLQAIAALAHQARSNPRLIGVVGAGAGALRRYSALVVTNLARQGNQAVSGTNPKPATGLQVAFEASGSATVDSFALMDAIAEPYALIVGRLESDGRRFLATHFDDETLGAAREQLRTGSRVFVENLLHGAWGYANRFAFDKDRLRHARDAARPLQLRSSYDHILVTRDGPLLEVTINRPEARNALNWMVHAELESVWDVFEAQDDLLVAIFTGAGTECFSAGNDLKFTADGAPAPAFRSGFGGITARRRTKPVIAAVNGFAFGAGMEMCLACDLIVADENAVFAQSEVRVGLFPGAGGLVRLPRQLPPKIANELILTGRKMGVEEAHRLGLVNRIAPAGGALASARTLAAEILACSPTAVRLAFAGMAEVAGIADEQVAIRHRLTAMEDLINSDDFLEGPTAFQEKRKPRWRNR